MRHIPRRQLSRRTLNTLARRTQLVLNDPDPADKARRLWESRRIKAFDEIRDVLAQMAPGRERCMYCEDSQGTDIEHFRPRASYPESAFVWENYLLACSTCNSNYKRNQFPLSAHGEVLLIDPTVDDPSDHLILSPRTGSYVAISEKGTHSIDVFGLERQTLQLGRRDAWLALLELIPAYANYRRAGDTAKAKMIADVIARFPFASVLVHLLENAHSALSGILMPQQIIDAVVEFPDIGDLANA